MSLTFKTGVIALASILTSVTAINGIVHAENVRVQPTGGLRLSIPLDCTASFVKEFTQVPVIKNSTNKVIPSGQKIYWQGYWAGQKSGAKKSITLSQPLSPGQSISTGVQLSGDSNSCKAYY